MGGASVDTYTHRHGFKFDALPENSECSCGALSASGTIFTSFITADISLLQHTHLLLREDHIRTLQRRKRGQSRQMVLGLPPGDMGDLQIWT